MKSLTLCAPLALAAVSALPAQTTWYVRADGGTLNSPARVAAKLSAQCDGKANVAYSAAANGGHCALGDYRSLYDDQATYGHAQVDHRRRRYRHHRQREAVPRRVGWRHLGDLQLVRWGQPVRLLQSDHPGWHRCPADPHPGGQLRRLQHRQRAEPGEDDTALCRPWGLRCPEPCRDPERAGRSASS